MIRTLKSNKFKIISMLMMIVILLVSTISMVPVNNVEAKTLAELEKEAEALEQKIKDTEKKLQNASTNIKKEKEKQQLLNTQITNVQDQMVLYKTRIDVCESQIKEKEAEIELKSAQIDTNEEMFAKRVRAMYITGSSSSTLSVLLNAKSFADFLNRADTLKRISKSDKELIDNLSKQKKELDNAKEVLKTNKADLVNTKTALDSREKTLASLYSQSESSEKELLALQKQYLENQKKYEAEQKKVEAAIDKAIQDANNNGTNPPEGEFRWPVPSYNRISSKFGWRYIFNKWSFHYGVDIAAPAGNDIVASQSGKVIVATKSTTSGYGYHIVVDHGGGYSTLYAHCSSIDVQVGDTVRKGQRIGGIGSTGNSTGNHLHFEVRVNNVKKDPLLYIREPR